MSREAVMEKKIWIAVAMLLAVPSVSRAATQSKQPPGLPSQDAVVRMFSQSVLPAVPAPDSDVDVDDDVADMDQDSQDQEQEQERRDREQERRDREQEKRDREQEKRDREQEKLDQLQELYEEGREALDEDRYDRAERNFAKLAELNGPQTDAALYWKAYAENRLGKRDTASATIADFKRRFPQSRWQKDIKALEIEVQQSSGRPANPEAQSNDELRMLALQGIINTDPERAIPFLGKVLDGSGSPKEKSKALFVLAQSGRPEARDILGKIARGQSNPDLQSKAIQYLGMFGGGESRKILSEVYASSSDPTVKRSILRSYMISNDREHLFEAAKNEKDEDVKREAIRQLGLVHGQNELQQLYKLNNSPDVRRELLQAFFLAGDSSKLLDAAQNEKDPELRRTAVRNLGLIHSDESAKALQAIYAKESSREVKEEVINAYFLQGNASAIVAIARTEKDPELKRAAISKLSLMHSKEGTDYLMEILQKN